MKDAGRGGAGEPGQTVLGAGGSVLSSIKSLSRWQRRKGCDGAASGGASAGVSAGIGGKAPTPSIATNTITTTGALGTKGIGGVPTSNDGIDGVEQDVLKVP